MVEGVAISGVLVAGAFLHGLARVPPCLWVITGFLALGSKNDGRREELQYIVYILKIRGHVTAQRVQCGWDALSCGKTCSRKVAKTREKFGG